MNTYPKALYKGAKTKRQLTKANDKSHEQQLRGQGYVDFAELPDDTADMDCQTLQNDWDDMDKVRERADELMRANIVNDFAKMTVKQLQEYLTSAGVQFGSGDNKNVLIDLAQNANNHTSQEAE